MDLTLWPTPFLYILMALVTAGFGVGMLVWQTAATRHALASRKGMLAGGVLLILLGGVVLLVQVYAIAVNSYGTVA